MQRHKDIVIILELVLKTDGLPIQIKSGIENYISDPENIRSQENLVYHLVDLELMANDNEIMDDRPFYKIAILFLNELINREKNTSKPTTGLQDAKGPGSRAGSRFHGGCRN